MSYIKSMLENHPQPISTDLAVLDDCITACADCGQTCTVCADACLAEPNRDMLIRCIRLNLDCADVCAATTRMLARQTETEWEVVNLQLQSCAASSRRCGEECDTHADHHAHCRICAEACRSCEQACIQLLSIIASAAAI